MKNIFKLSFLLAFTVVLFNSCAIDDDAAVLPQGELVAASLDKTGEIFVYPGSDIQLDFVLSSATASATLFKYTLNGENQTIELTQGQTAVSMTFPNAVGAVYDIELTDAFGLNNTAVTVEGNKAVTFIGVPAPNADALEILMLWSDYNNNANDIDLWVTDNPPAFGFEVSQGVGNSEFVSFANTYPDDTYNALAREWSSATSTTEVTMYFFHPDGTIETFTDLILQGSNFNFFVEFDKVGSVYTTTKVPTVPVF